MPGERDEVAKRRIERRKKIRKRRLIITFLVFLIAALCIGAVLSLTVLFPVKNVSASGSRLYSGKQIVSASGINSKNNLFTLPESTVTKNIRKNCPYVDTVVLTRELPGTVRIKVTDAKEFACYKVYDKYYVVSQKGTVLNSYDKFPENTFEIICDGVTCKIGKKVTFKDSSLEQTESNLSAQLTKNKITVNCIDLTDKHNIELKVDGRFDVIFGDMTDYEKKVAHLAGMVKDIEADKSGKINLTMWSPSNPQGSFTTG